MQRLFLLLLCGWMAMGAADAPAPRFSLPIDCRFGQTCFIQQYFDHSPGPEAKDYRCGDRVYDGHDGVDLRLATTAMQRRGVAVLAAAPGIVAGMRNDMPDQLLTPAGRAAIAGRECGNGLVLKHEGGWETQYCHMAKGSVAVRPGMRVAAGQRLGLVGLSGETEFPHLHFSVRHDGVKLDPFAPALGGSCSASGARGLWAPAAATALAYKDSEIINIGFASAPVTMDQVEQETTVRPTRHSPAVVLFVRAIGLDHGDMVRLQILRPDGSALVTDEAPAQGRAQWLAFAGKRRPPEGWAAGGYAARCTILRNGRTVASAQAELML